VLKRAARWKKRLASPTVLDSSAILAVLFQEAGAEKISDLLDGGLLSTVNLAEVHTILTLRGVPPDISKGRVQEMGCTVCPFDEEAAKLTGELAAQTHPYGLSLGDRACLALAMERGGVVYTTDLRWKDLDLGVQVEVIR
jgi:ribonuclease VapC